MNFGPCILEVNVRYLRIPLTKSAIDCRQRRFVIH